MGRRREANVKKDNRLPAPIPEIWGCRFLFYQNQEICVIEITGIIIDTIFSRFYNCFSTAPVIDTLGRNNDGNTPINLESERMQMIWSIECSRSFARAFLYMCRVNKEMIGDTKTTYFVTEWRIAV